MKDETDMKSFASSAAAAACLFFAMGAAASGSEPPPAVPDSTPFRASSDFDQKSKHVDAYWVTHLTDKGTD